MTPQDIVALALLGVNMLVLFVSLTVKADIANLRAHMYEHFVSKEDVSTFLHHKG